MGKWEEEGGQGESITHTLWMASCSLPERCHKELLLSVYTPPGQLVLRYVAIRDYQYVSKGCLAAPRVILGILSIFFVCYSSYILCMVLYVWDIDDVLFPREYMHVRSLFYIFYRNLPH